MSSRSCGRSACSNERHDEKTSPGDTSRPTILLVGGSVDDLASVASGPASPGCQELLAAQVADRTAELQASNQQLRQQVAERQRIEAELRDSERRYRELFDNATDLILLLEVTNDGRFRCIEVNNAFERQIGLSRQKMLGSYVGSSVSAEAQVVLVAMYQRCLDAGKTIEEDFTIDVPVGRRSFQTTVVPLFDPSGRIYRLISVSRDITERRQREALEEARLAVFEQLARGKALVEILELVVAYVENSRAGYLGCIRLVSADGKRLLTTAAPTLPADYNAALDELQIGDGIGSCGAAGWRGETVIAEDVRNHPYWVNYKDLALRAGLLSCWSLPIFDSIGKLLGTFAIYQRQTGLPSDDDREMMRQVGYLAAAAIERKQADERVFL